MELIRGRGINGRNVNRICVYRGSKLFASIRKAYADGIIEGTGWEQVAIAKLIDFNPDG